MFLPILCTLPADEIEGRRIVPRERLIGLTLLLALAVLVVVGKWRIGTSQTVRDISVVRRPQGVMGTVCTLAAVVPENELQSARDVLVEAESRLRNAEARMSNWLDDSEVSRLNATGTGVVSALSSEMRRVIDAARIAFEDTAGTFDITCRPQMDLWRRAGEDGQLPGEAQRNTCRLDSNWELVELTECGIIKRSGTVCIDLGGIAKGYAIDRAVDCLREAGVRGGMVELGGDLACFGRQADGEPWHVEINHPHRLDGLARLRVVDRAVATSGNYARYTEIDGKQYSHIVDPRTCLPTDATESVTVVAPTAMTADIWATAISVLGVEGLELLPDGVDALLLVDSEDGSSVVCTPGFRAYFDGAVPDGLEFWEANTADGP